MIEHAPCLNEAALDAIAELESRVVAADGGRLKIEWGVLRSGSNVDGFLWWEGQRLLGFLGVYSSDPLNAELAGMVDPEARRRGIATALLDAAMPLCHERSFRSMLLIVPRRSAAGRELARKRGAALEHSEHALVLLDDPTDGATDPRIALRSATPADVGELARILAAGFGEPPDPARVLDQLADELWETVVVELDGRPVGTARLGRDSDVAGVYAFAIDPAWQGRGIGRDVLRRICRQLRAEGFERIRLEVAVENDRALGLYTSLGFTQVTTEDYYALPTVTASATDARPIGH
jgi:ribosomal protein S18 acetylase RimI-like enzyme